MEAKLNVAGKTVQIDPSAQGHAWRPVRADELPANIAQEIAGEIIDGRCEEGEIVASNGLHYRWF